MALSSAPLSDSLALDADLGEAPAANERELALAVAAAIRGHIEKTYPPGKRPVRRDAHPKAHGCVRAEFRVNADLPPRFAHGVFVPGAAYQAWIRFSNGSGDPTRADSKGDARGMAIKLLGVPGEKVLPEERGETTHDFVMIDHPIFVVDDPRRYLTLVQRSNSDNPLLRFVAPFALGLRGMLIARAITTKTIASPLETRYWSTTAYRLGLGNDKTAVKFSAKPCLAPTSKVPRDASPSFLREAMIAHLAEREARFDFLVQPRTSPSMGVEASTIAWRESDAPFYKVATITIAPQRFSSPAQDAFGDGLSFTPWHALPEHRPLGVVNRVRRVVYQELSKLRHELNAMPRREPTAEEA